MPKKDWKAAPAGERALRIVEALKQQYEPVSGLVYHNPFELLIAVILSAQTRDEQVNQATPALFSRYPDAHALSQADVNDVDEIIRKIGFHAPKARNIIATSRILADKYDGDVPKSMEELVELPGVGRKTANVVLGTAFGQPAITVDTHFRRVSQRLHLTHKNDPGEIEMELRAIIPPEEQIDFSHRMIWHGRKTCHARKPKCSVCVIARYCPLRERLEQ